MISRNILKNEIDKVSDEYLPVLYKILKSLKKPKKKTNALKKKNWEVFISHYSGCFEASPLKRHSQGNYETRENFS